MSLTAVAAALSLTVCLVTGVAQTRPARLTQGARKPVTHTITIDGTRFEPGSLTVHTGDTVVWVNRDPFPHTATATSRGFDSKQISSGASWTFRPGKPAALPYGCTLHPTMKAILRVE